MIITVQFSSVAQSCPTLCDPMNRSTPGLPVHHQLPEFTSNSCPSSRWCHPAISSSVVPFSSCPQSLPASESFPMSQLFAWSGQSIGFSASASFLPKNTQGWSLEWTGWISLQSKGLSRVFFNTEVQKHQFFGADGSNSSGLNGKEYFCQCRRVGLTPGLIRSPGEANGNPLQYSCLGNPMDTGAWRAAVHGVAKELDMT